MYNFSFFSKHVMKRFQINLRLANIEIFILTNDIGEMEIAPREPWITEAMIKKMEERRIAKTTNIKEYRRLNNQLRRETDRAKEVYMEEICEEIMDLQKKGRYDLMYQTIRGKN